MGQHTNQIGTFQFDDLRGGIGFRQERLKLIRRPGTDGAVIQRQGQQSREFQVTSITYQLSFQTAKDILESYKALCGQNPQQVVQNSIVKGAFAVLSVEEDGSPRAVASVAGQIVANAKVLHIVRWTLVG